MKLTRLRIAGFKTFVEQADIVIEPGLTGVVGPNGCGKSNLVEALRWVMGESSHKNMRASAMDDVIFGGSATRPSRNMAEVTLAIDNSDRRAPAAFNGSDSLEVSRRIERSSGSTYSVNGREVRARDLQLLFADAATGARSPALVRQGQISELIAAKPQARRRILEDAAGIAGLHARRHEAELRLKQAEDNLLRVEDVLQEIDAQADNLRRQGRQAARYRGLSADIRRIEVQLAAAGFRAVEAERLSAEASARDDVRAIADRTAAQGEAATIQAVAAHEIGALREAEISLAAAVRRLTQARTELDGEERRAKERAVEVERRIQEGERDEARQLQASQDAEDTIRRLQGELKEASGGTEFAALRRAALEGELKLAERELAEGEASLAAAQAAIAEAVARRAALQREHAGERARADKAAREIEAIVSERTRLEAARAGDGLDPLRTLFKRAASISREAEEAMPGLRQSLRAARNTEAGRRREAETADKAAQRLETELGTLRKLFSSAGGRPHAAMLDAIAVEAGLEIAVAAAFGDDLDASPDPAAPLRWLDTGAGDGDPPLPEGARPLLGLVSGPSALTRRLRQIGLVEREDGLRLAGRLAPGQRLVSRAGELWRWDGLTASRDAPSPAARRLAERNRMAELERAAIASRREADALRAVAAEAEREVEAAARRETEGLDSAQAARRRLDEAREAVARAERRDSEGAARLLALAEALDRVRADGREAGERAATAEATLEALPGTQDGDTAELRARTYATELRGRVAELRAALAAMTREADGLARRRTALAADLDLWKGRAARSEAAFADIAGRLAATRTERDELAAAPDTFAKRRYGLAAEIQDAEARRHEAAERLRDGETHLREADRAARATLDLLAEARERRAASEARAESAARRVAELGRAIADTFDSEPAALLTLAGPIDPRAFDPQAAEAKLAGLKADRERLGGVNLRAEEELAEAEDKHQRLAAERTDLTEAIKRLRQAISGLNREGRERLNAAFGTVDAHFRRLFTRLFGGGEAELTLVDSDDPLEAGLDIMARPPGKKAQLLSLLSGGEQALTATALIFAVFLTNPSPICVLDEVDAPLDDANVERFCDLLRDMAGETDTRFMVITHNPITMARMDRLFGVTMAERGLSQLVSVDLSAAERLRDAG